MIIETEWLAFALLASIIASVPLWVGWFEQRFEAVENRWDGFVCGVAVAYVCLYMLPKLGMATFEIFNDGEDHWTISQYRAYFFLLASILVYMVVERVERTNDAGRITAFGFAVSVQCVYCFLVGYVAVELPLPYFGYHILANLILALHLLGMMHHLRKRHPAAGEGAVPFVFALLTVAGYVTALITELPYPLVVSGSALVAGVILVDVMAEELPRGKRGRLGWFLGGAAMFAVVFSLVRGD